MTVSSISSKYWRGDQDVLRKTIKRNLKVNYEESSGCIYSIRHPGKPLFVAHMDTVGVCNMNKPLRFSKNRITRQNSGLGADDRAGINIIMNHHEELNFLFTRDEEIGRKGAQALMNHGNFKTKLGAVSCIIQLDCTGHKVVRGEIHGYCQKDMMDDIKIVIPDIKDTRGSYSDLDEFTSMKAGVNLSVGYYKQHTKSEHLIITEYTFVNMIIPQLNEGMTGDYKPPVKKVYTNYTHKYTKKKDKQLVPVKKKEKTNSVEYVALKHGYMINGVYHFYSDNYLSTSDRGPMTPPVTEVHDNPKDLDTDMEDKKDGLFALTQYDCDNCVIESHKLQYVDVVGMYLCPRCLRKLKKEINGLKETAFEL